MTTKERSSSAKKSARGAVGPAQTLVKKRSWLIPVILVAIVIVAAIVIVLATKSSSAKGKILVTVNGEPLYEEDIEEQYQQLPAEYRAQYSRDYILNQSIDRTLLVQEAKKRNLDVTEEEIDTQIASITSQFGIEEEKLVELLKAQNISLERYRQLVREELLLNKVVQEAVLSRVTVTEEEIIAYYDSHEAEFSAPDNGAIISHILVANETTAKDLIEQLGDGASFDQLAQKYSLDSAAQGGYLGIVTPDTPFVQEFKDAALKLRVGQYTKTPVQTQFGYHIIMRGADKEPFKLVRERILSQLKLERQVAAFQTFIGNLRSQAIIKHFTAQGAISQPRTAGDLDAFATCVSGKATLYGTNWSDFFKEQQALFGDSFSLLTYVDCDAKPHLCSAANVEKYPTWVITGNDEHTGKLSLQELATKTGCELPA